VRGLHERLKDASLSRRVQCVAALGAESLVEAVCDPALRSGECVAPAGLAGRVGALDRRGLPEAAGSRAQAERFLAALDDAGEAGFGALRRRADELEARRLELASGERRISAMVRARNEEEFLRPAVESIVAAVDEVVLVENQSDDRTPEIAAKLAEEHPEKVRLLEYPHRIARVGSQQRDASDGRGELRSIHEHCNWVLERCRHPFVLKWDADMVALPAFYAWLQRWRESEQVVMAFHGANVHPDREHLLAARCSDRAELEARLGGEDLPEWATRLTYDSVEPRLFPHWEARFDGSWEYLEAHVSPFFFGTQRRRARLEPDEPCFLHLKFCKRDPFAFYMPDIAAVIRDNMGTGPALTDEQRRTLERWAGPTRSG
jgi:hypothetical protein